ncbi:unnamed protein product [Callosobruchus maculatus]|uniref:Uncharacterized protein n=1 Tax=Callosobruchus maculatus TaxID=64391 RepID=A0A653D135_CALMS|nr:unnamed protein product [Callosobruchus maculatus]
MVYGDSTILANWGDLNNVDKNKEGNVALPSTSTAPPQQLNDFLIRKTPSSRTSD